MNVPARFLYPATGAVWIALAAWFGFALTFRPGPPTVKPGEWIPAISGKARYDGWYHLEPGFRWSRGSSARFEFRAADVPPAAALELGLRGVLGPQKLTLEVNGKPAGELAVEGGAQVVTQRLPPQALRAQANNAVAIGISDPRSPGPADPRLLGIALEKFRYVAAP